MPIYGSGNVSSIFAYQNTASAVGGTTSETTIYSTTIPGNILGANGSLRITYLETHTNSANSKIIRVKFGGTMFHGITLTSTAGVQQQVIIRNQNSTAVQVAAPTSLANNFGSHSAVNGAGTVDTTANQTLLVTGQTSLETGFAATSCTRASNVVTVNKASHGLNTGEYVQVAGATPSTFNADPVQITKVDADNFTYANTGGDEGTTVQPTVKRYSVIQMDSILVEVIK